MRLKLSLTLVLTLLALTAWAKPAPWYWWISKIDGARVCLQNNPGSGWQRDGQPFSNSRCRHGPLR